jgi:hypothetical protein
MTECLKYIADTNVNSFNGRSWMFYEVLHVRHYVQIRRQMISWPKQRDGDKWFPDQSKKVFPVLSYPRLCSLSLVSPPLSLSSRWRRSRGGLSGLCSIKLLYMILVVVHYHSNQMWVDHVTFISDVMVQVMPLVGRDWSQSSVAWPFFAIHVWWILRFCFSFARTLFQVCFIFIGDSELCNSLIASAAQKDNWQFGINQMLQIYSEYLYWTAWSTSYCAVNESLPWIINFTVHYHQNIMLPPWLKICSVLTVCLAQIIMIPVTIEVLFWTNKKEVLLTLSSCMQHHHW